MAELSRAERLAAWKEKKGAAVGAKANKNVEASIRDATRMGPRQLDPNRVATAGKASIGPGTPIHKLKQRVEKEKARAKGPAEPKSRAAIAPVLKKAVAAPVVQPWAKTSANVQRCLSASKLAAPRDYAQMEKLSTFLKSQIAESDALAAVACPEAAATLLKELLDHKETAAVGEMALYWAARSRIEENAGDYQKAQSLLTEGEAFLTVPLQQRVLAKVVAAFETRMEEHESKGFGSAFAAITNTAVTTAAVARPQQAREVAAADPCNASALTSPPSLEAPAGSYRFDPAVDASFEESSSAGTRRANKALRFSASPKIIGVGGMENTEPLLAEAVSIEHEADSEDVSSYLVHSAAQASAGATPGAGKVLKQNNNNNKEANAEVTFEDGESMPAPTPATSSSRSGKRKGTPFPTRSSKRLATASPGVDAQGEAAEETPVRRSRRIAANQKNTGPTPSPMRRELEAMLS